jgi:phospho-N-acetylmuramoyl-pentapeptide-transferase
MGGLLIWVTVVFVIIIFWILSLLFPGTPLVKFNFLSRSQTWLPLFTLIVASLVGLIDDILVVSGAGKYIGGGLSFKKRLIIVFLIGLIGGSWFFYKLGWDAIFIPFLGSVSIGFWYIPLFILVTIACWSGGIIDGLDGLSGGTFASIFGAFTVISFSLGRYDLAVFCAVITGAIFSFLWFNIPPARFYMGETGILGLTTTLAVIAFITDSVYVLPIIAGLLVIEVLSVIIQLLSKKIRHKKVFLSTPIHHHFEAIGWPAYKVTMRAWIIGIVLAIMGVALRLFR